MVGRHNDGEIRVKFRDSVRGVEAFIIGPTCPPAENILELCFLAAAAKESSAKRVTLVIPYLGYNRQDRKNEPRVPLSARVVCRMLSDYADRVLLFDLHSEPTAGFFKKHVRVDHLYASPVIVPYLKGIIGDNYVVAAADGGSSKRAGKYSDLLGSRNLVIFNKQRPEDGVVAEKGILIIGDVAGKDVVFVDDMVDTAGTLCADAVAAKKAGAQRIFACATHALFSGKALERLDESPIDELIITDTIPIPQEKLQGRRIKITTLSVESLLANAIRNLYDGKSVSALIP